MSDRFTCNGVFVVVFEEEDGIECGGTDISIGIDEVLWSVDVYGVEVVIVGIVFGLKDAFFDGA